MRPALPAPEPNPEANNREPWRKTSNNNDRDAAAGNPGAAARDAYNRKDLNALFAAVAKNTE